MNGIKIGSLVLVVLCGTLAFGQTTWTVRQDGGGDFTTLAAAVAGAAAGDTIQIADPAGSVTYDEELDVMVNLTIEDVAGADVVLTSNGDEDARGVIQVSNGAQVRLSGLTILDATCAAVWVAETGTAVTVEDSVIAGCKGYSNVTGFRGGSVNCLVRDGAQLTLNRVTMIDTGRPQSDGVFVHTSGGATLLVNDSYFEGEGLDSSGDWGTRETGFPVTAGVVTINSSTIIYGRGTCAMPLGYPTPATVNLNRCLLRNNWTAGNPTEGLVRTTPWGADLSTGSTINLTNCVLDARPGSDPAAGETDAIVAVNASTVNVNYCTILYARKGIRMQGNPPLARVANSLIGLCSQEGIFWWNDANFTSQLYIQSNHFFANLLSNHPNTGAGLTVFTDPAYPNTYEEPASPPEVPWPGVDPADVDYEIQGDGPKMLDLGTSPLLFDGVANDLDEVGIRPRGAANDKGAQEGQAGSEPTPTPTCAADLDQDGVCDENETLDPFNEPNKSTGYLADTDLDGLYDGDEDANRNGLQDAGETNALNRDTDGDNWTDGVEVLLGSDPLSAASPGAVADADNDRLPDSIDPDNTKIDTDGDGWRDWYEAALFGLPAVTDANVAPPAGDVNVDTFKSNVDALIIQSLFLGNINLSNPVFQGQGFSNSDVSGDRQASNIDALIVQSFFIGNLALLPLF